MSYITDAGDKLAFYTPRSSADEAARDWCARASDKLSSIDVERVAACFYDGRDAAPGAVVARLYDLFDRFSDPPVRYAGATVKRGHQQGWTVDVEAGRALDRRHPADSTELDGVALLGWSRDLIDAGYRLPLGAPWAKVIADRFGGAVDNTAHLAQVVMHLLVSRVDAHVRCGRDYAVRVVCRADRSSMPRIWISSADDLLPQGRTRAESVAAAVDKLPEATKKAVDAAVGMFGADADRPLNRAERRRYVELVAPLVDRMPKADRRLVCGPFAPCRLCGIRSTDEISDTCEGCCVAVDAGAAARDRYAKALEALEDADAEAYLAWRRWIPTGVTELRATGKATMRGPAAAAYASLCAHFGKPAEALVLSLALLDSTRTDLISAVHHPRGTIDVHLLVSAAK